MLYFSNQELAETFHVSVRTVRNWIDAAKADKLDLVLHTRGKRSYISNTSKNIATIKQLAEKNKKYRPLKTHKTVMPRPEFYDLYTQAQIYDIVSNIEIHHEIPRQYSYFARGADSWDAYATRLATEAMPNSVNSTIKLLEMNESYIDTLLEPYEQVNVVDIGAGNVVPIRKFLEHLLSTGKLGRYVAIDISQAMLDIAKRNIDEWFGDKIKCECVQLDFSQDRFTDILAEEYIKKGSETTVNLVLFLGGMLANVRSQRGVLQVIHESMGTKDYLLYEYKLDSETTRRLFDFRIDQGGASLAPIHDFVVDLLNIDKSLYDVELGYDASLKERYERIRFKVAVTIQFKFQNGERLIHLNKNDSLLVWRGLQQSALEVLRQFEANDFYPLHMSQTDNQEYMLSILRIKQD